MPWWTSKVKISTLNCTRKQTGSQCSYNTVMVRKSGWDCRKGCTRQHTEICSLWKLTERCEAVEEAKIKQKEHNCEFLIRLIQFSMLLKQQPSWHHCKQIMSTGHVSQPTCIEKHIQVNMKPKWLIASDNFISKNHLNPSDILVITTSYSSKLQCSLGVAQKSFFSHF